MKRKLITAMVLAAFICVNGSADLRSEAEAHVWVDVVSNIAVGIQDAQVDLGNVQTGTFSGVVRFRIDANMETIDLQVIATNLYKGDSLLADPVGGIIPVSGGGAQVTPTNGSQIEGGTGFLPWASATELHGFDAQESQIGTFESGQLGHFSQEVDVEVTWLQDDPERTTGEYSGYVKLIGMIMPQPTSTPGS